MGPEAVLLGPGQEPEVPKCGRSRNLHPGSQVIGRADVFLVSEQKVVVVGGACRKQLLLTWRIQSVILNIPHSGITEATARRVRVDAP